MNFCLTKPPFRLVPLHHWTLITWIFGSCFKFNGICLMCWTFSLLLIRQIGIGSSLKGRSADFLLTVCECLPYCCLDLLLCSFLTLMMITLRWFRVASRSIFFLILDCFSFHQLKYCCLRCICARLQRKSSIYVNLLTRSWVLRNFHKRTVLEMMVAVQFSVILFIFELIQAFPHPLITFCLDWFGLFLCLNCL